MASSITNDMKYTLLNELKLSVDSDNDYFIGIARSDEFVEPSDISSLRFQNQTRCTLQSVKRVSGTSFIVPTVTWTNGTIYNQYSDGETDQSEFYVVNSNREVFICISQSISDTGFVLNSTVEPTASEANYTSETFETSDGYKWRYLYKISTIDYSRFRTNAHTPVKLVTHSSYIPEEIEQLSFQNNAISGEVLNIVIDSGGTGYETAPTITVRGNGDSAQFVSKIYNGSIVRVDVDSDGLGNFLHGKNYDYADVIVSSGDAKLRPVLSGREGTHGNPVKTLKSNRLMIQTDFVSTENSEIVSENKFRQTVLMRGIKSYGSDSDYIYTAGNALKSAHLTSVPDTLFNDEILLDVSGEPVAKVFSVDNDNQILYYYNDEETGFQEISGTLTGKQNIETTIQIDELIDPSIDAYSGIICYVNNILPVDRSVDQTENVHVVIQVD